MKNFIFGFLGGLNSALLIPYQMLKSEHMKKEYVKNKDKLPSYVDNLTMVRVGAFLHNFLIACFYVATQILISNNVQDPNSLSSWGLYLLVSCLAFTLTDVVFYVSKKCRLI